VAESDVLSKAGGPNRNFRTAIVNGIEDKEHEIEPLESLEAEEGTSIQGSDESKSEEEAAEAKNAPSTTRLGRTIRTAPRLITEAGYSAVNYDIELTIPKQHN
jgi:hypothetical protein